MLQLALVNSLKSMGRTRTARPLAISRWIRLTESTPRRDAPKVLTGRPCVFAAVTAFFVPQGSVVTED